MSNSNILSVFSPPPSRDLTQEEVKDCLPCQIMASISALGAGCWFLSGRVFDDTENKLTKEESLKKNPIWWRNSIRAGGVLLIGFGLNRGGEGWLWKREKEYKKLD